METFSRSPRKTNAFVNWSLALKDKVFKSNMFQACAARRMREYTSEKPSQHIEPICCAPCF